MKTLTFEVFKSNEGQFSVAKHEDSFALPTPMQYLMANDPKRLEDLRKLPGKKFRHKLWRLGKSETFAKWADANKKAVTWEKAGVAEIEYDGRLVEGSVKCAIIRALQDGEREVRVFPRSNANKPAHLHMVYVKEFTFTEEA